MTDPAGITTQATVAYDGLIAGDVKLAPVRVDANATVAVGQVFEYDGTGNNSVNKTTAGVANGPYCVCNETKTITGDCEVLCVVNGDVYFDELDTTSKADAEIIDALRGSGINVIKRGVR